MAALVGMGADQVLSLEVVLPNGRYVSVSEDSYPDLYWALRGGGGSKLWTCLPFPTRRRLTQPQARTAS